jgi:hypothetical protein
MRNAVTLELEVEVTPGEVYRYLGYGSNSRRSRRAETLLDEMWEGALALLHPRGAYRIVDRAAATAAGMPDAGGEVGVAVCTVGGELEEVSAACVVQGRLLDALLLDAVGSAAADAAADSLNLALCTVAREEGWYTAPRVSPGYGQWDVAFQSRLLALLPAAALGISLTPGQMMVPRKSVSFAVCFADRPPAEHRPGAACERCGLERCRHRIAPFRGGVEEEP